MPEPINIKQQSIKRPFKLVILFVLMIIIGFCPWENILSIQITDSILVWITSASMGLIGLLGLSLTLIIYMRRKNIRFLFLIITLLSFTTVISGFLLIIIYVLPTFKWQDKDVYRNGNEYLVVQKQETFVTSNQMYQRIILTPSPSSMIRKVEKQYDLKDDDKNFEGNEIVYEGRTWLREPTMKKE